MIGRDYDKINSMTISSKVKLSQENLFEIKAEAIMNIMTKDKQFLFLSNILDKFYKKTIEEQLIKNENSNIIFNVFETIDKEKSIKLLNFISEKKNYNGIISEGIIKVLDYALNNNILYITIPYFSYARRDSDIKTELNNVFEETKKWLENNKSWGGIITFHCDEKTGSLFRNYASYYFPYKRGPNIRPLTIKEKSFIDSFISKEKSEISNFRYRYFHAGSKSEALKMHQHKKDYAPPELRYYPKPLPDVFSPIPLENNITLPKNLRESIIYTLYGQAVGDAIGLATEFLNKTEAYYYYGMEPFNYNHYFIDGHRSRWMDLNFVCADWTDDTDQCLLLLDSIVCNNGNFDPKDLALRFKYWITYGWEDVGDLCPCGIGANFSSVVHNNNFVKDPIGTSKMIWEKGGCKSAANGSVMRTSVAAIPYFWNESKVKENSKLFSQVTHYDPRCSASVITISYIISKLLLDRKDILKIIDESIIHGKNELSKKMDIDDYIKFANAKSFDELELNHLIGYTFKPMGCAILCLKKAFSFINDGEDKDNSQKEWIFETLISEVTREAGDADTNGAVVGAVLGCYLKAIPERFLKLQNIKWYQERINRILKLYQLPPI